MDMALDHVVPESLEWLHTDEGPEYVLLPPFPVSLLTVSTVTRRHGFTEKVHLPDSK